MPVLVLDVLKYAFLAILYLFVARAVKAIYVEIRPQAPGGRAPKSSAKGASERPPKRTKKPTRTVAVIEDEKLKGKTFAVDGELFIGRSSDSDITLDVSYVSSKHARLFVRDEKCMLEDLGSTNGTYLNRRRITAPTELQRGDQIKIGRTIMEMRK